MPFRGLSEDADRTAIDRLVDDLIRDHAARAPSAATRVAAHLPSLRTIGLRAILDRPLALDEARQVIAREHDLARWDVLEEELARRAVWRALSPYPRFADAVAALDAGDLATLAHLLDADPGLARAPGHVAPPFGYFSGATLLHHVAANLYRAPLPSNIVDVARLLLDRGADPNATTLGVHGGTTVELLLTSQHASESGHAGPLLDLLTSRGAAIALHAPGALDPPLIDHAPRAAEWMVDHGAVPDVCHAAGLGRMDLLRAFFDDAGRLRERPQRRDEHLDERDAIGLALLFAYVNRRPEAVDFLLEKDGNWSRIGVNNGTALHRAAGEGDLAMTQRLVARGADPHDRNNPFHATPLSWADHFAHRECFDWLVAHDGADLHDAACFGLVDVVRNRIARAPADIDRRIDQWVHPWTTALHQAARLGREAIVRLLLDGGADPNALSGDGKTALDYATDGDHGEIASLLMSRSARHARDVRI